MPSSVAESLKPGETLVRRTETTTYERRGGWLPWLLGLLLIPALLALLASFTSWGERDAVQDDLGAKSLAALSAAGIPGAKVNMDGVVANVSDVPADKVDAARAAVEDVSGVWSANVTGSGGSGSGATPPAPASANPSASVVPPAASSGPLGFELKNGQVVLTGNVPDEAARQALVAAATQVAGGRPVVNNLAVAPGATLPAAPADLAKAVVLLGTAPGDRGVKWDGNTITLTGSVPTEADKAAATQAVAAAAPGVKFDNQLTVAAPAPAPAVDKAALQKQINDLLAAQGITFQPNSSTLTGPGAATLQKIAPLLAGKDVSLEVSGHIADVANSLDGQQLSEQRAAAVKAQLAQLGVPADKMTAKGFGASKPLPGNAPSAPANRRVEITVI
ncbi:Outer membrane protein [Alloactinosynnema sp. L-07]|uniref:OmpA family protein n=1 Tax=Alloactinosynnema sp. L-07 TaxID=1653480 RepID=UPI00065EF453|nr:OmpA family protein [Alloactinosynnema sp. L-07]CRK60113.1 Outer membrane protein [Alloactinosynnema sp. L-07]